MLHVQLDGKGMFVGYVHDLHGVMSISMLVEHYGAGV